MGLEIKRNKKGEYQIINSISDESLHPKKKWVSADEAKRILINRAIWKFIDTAIEIDMTFPNGYHVNGKYEQDNKKLNYHEWHLNALRSKDCEDILNKKYEELHKRLNLDFNIP